MSSKYGEPWTHGHQTTFAVRHMDHLYNRDGDGVVTVHGIPGNCTMEELEGDPRWAAGLKLAARIKDAMNALAGMEPSDVAELLRLLNIALAALVNPQAFDLDELLPQIRALLARLPK